MSEHAKKIIESGSGIYQMNRSQAGEAYRAAKKVKAYEISYWTRNRKKGKSK
jgi:hypothetical protein